MNDAFFRMRALVRFGMRSGIMASLVALAGLGLPAQFAAARSIGVNFHGGQNTAQNGASVFGEAGAPGYVQDNWNNIPFTYSNFGFRNNLEDSAGVMTETSFVFQGSNFFDTEIPMSTENDRLMRGLLNVRPDEPGYISFRNLPFETYDVVIYFDGDNSGYNQVRSYAIGDRIIFGRDAAYTNFSGTFIEVPDTSTTDQGFSTPAGNFVVFRGLTGNGFSLEITVGSHTGSTGRAQVNAIQVVEVPEPAGVALAIAGAVIAAFGGFRRKRRRVARSG